MMEVIRIRRDKLDLLGFHCCVSCYKTPRENDIIIQTTINDERMAFCSEECILNYLKDLGDTNNIFVRKSIEIYELTPTQALCKDIDNMKPNTQLKLDGGFTVEYFETNGLRRHYLLNSSTTSSLFRNSYELVSYINRNKEI